MVLQWHSYLGRRVLEKKTQEKLSQNKSPGSYPPQKEKNPPGKKSPNPNFFWVSFSEFFELVLIFSYVIFKILLHSELVFSLIRFTLPSICNLVIWKHLSLTKGYFSVFYMGYFAILGVIECFLLYRLLEESKHYFKKFVSEICSDEFRKSVKILVWKRCCWKNSKVSFENRYKISFWYMSENINPYTWVFSAKNKVFFVFLFSKRSSRKSPVIKFNYVQNSHIQQWQFTLPSCKVNKFE